MQLTLDRKSFVDILSEGQGDISGAMLPPPGGLWGLPPEILAKLPGYGLDVAANRAEARRLMEKHGAEQPARRQGRDPQHPAVPRSGGYHD